MNIKEGLRERAEQFRQRRRARSGPTADEFAAGERNSQQDNQRAQTEIDELRALRRELVRLGYMDEKTPASDFHLGPAYTAANILKERGIDDLAALREVAAILAVTSSDVRGYNKRVLGNLHKRLEIEEDQDRLVDEIDQRPYSVVRGKYIEPKGPVEANTLAGKILKKAGRGILGATKITGRAGKQAIAGALSGTKEGLTSDIQVELDREHGEPVLRITRPRNNDPVTTRPLRKVGDEIEVTADAWGSNEFLDNLTGFLSLGRRRKFTSLWGDVVVKDVHGGAGDDVLVRIPVFRPEQKAAEINKLAGRYNKTVEEAEFIPPPSKADLARPVARVIMDQLPEEEKTILRDDLGIRGNRRRGPRRPTR